MDKELLSKRNIDGLISVVQYLVTDQKMREVFAADPIAALEEVGVQISDTELAKTVASRLRESIERQIALRPAIREEMRPFPLRPISEPFPRPIPDIRPIPEPRPTLPGTAGEAALGPIAATAAATAVATGAVSTVHSVATAEADLTHPFAFEKVKLDFQKIRSIERILELDTEIRNLRGGFTGR